MEMCFETNIVKGRQKCREEGCFGHKKRPQMKRPYRTKGIGDKVGQAGKGIQRK